MDHNLRATKNESGIAHISPSTSSNLDTPKGSTKLINHRGASSEIEQPKNQNTALDPLVSCEGNLEALRMALSQPSYRRK